MARLNYRCENDHEFEGLSPDMVAEGDICPKCKMAGHAVFSGGWFGMKDHLAEYRPLDGAERAFDLENSAFIRQNAQEVLDGKLELRIPKSLPRELRPQVPEELRKRWF